VWAGPSLENALLGADFQFIFQARTTHPVCLQARLTTERLFPRATGTRAGQAGISFQGFKGRRPKRAKAARTRTHALVVVETSGLSTSLFS
jgi:hypothetical protein